MRRHMLLGLLLVALLLGVSIAWIDTRPTWDDTGITVGLLLIAAAGFGAVYPRLAWLWALALGAWIPLFNIMIAHNFGSLLALVLAFIGAYVGVGIRSLFFPRQLQAPHSDQS